jgi:hypothetical protein
MMVMTNKVLAITLIALLAGGTLGAILMHSNNGASAAAPTTASDTTYPTDANRNAVMTNQLTDQANLGTYQFKTAEEQTAYKVGFADGVRTSGDLRNGTTRTANVTPTRVSYNHAQPRGRSFWSKHRDKLTLAMGTGGGALLGALIGGGKGAGIGALAGAGGSALYTYKLRHRRHR